MPVAANYAGPRKLETIKKAPILTAFNTMDIYIYMVSRLGLVSFWGNVRSSQAILVPSGY